MLVEIKTWKEMEEEFGLNKYGLSIACYNTYIREMEDEMPEDRIIEVDKNITRSHLYNWVGSSLYWSISKVIIKRIVE